MVTSKTMKLIKLQIELENNKENYNRLQYTIMKSIINLSLKKNTTKEEKAFLKDFNILVSLIK